MGISVSHPRRTYPLGLNFLVPLWLSAYTNCFSVVQLPDSPANLVRWRYKRVVEGPITLVIPSTYLKPLCTCFFSINYVLGTLWIFNSTRLLFHIHVLWTLVLLGFTFFLMLVISALYCLKSHQNFWSYDNNSCFPILL